MAKKYLSKIVTFVLAIVLVAGTVPASAFADTTSIKDGKYTVPVALYNSTGTSVSMAAAAIADEAQLSVKDGEATIRLTLNTLNFSGQYGNLTKMYYYNSFEDVELGNKNEATVLTTRDAQTGPAGNSSTIVVPETVEFKLPNTDSTDVYLSIAVDVMESMGMGEQIAMLKIDYDNMAAAPALADGTYKLDAKFVGVDDTAKESFAGTIQQAYITVENGVGTVTLALQSAEMTMMGQTLPLYILEVAVGTGEDKVLSAVLYEDENGYATQIEFQIPALEEYTALTMAYTVPDYNNGEGWVHKDLERKLFLDFSSAVEAEIPGGQVDLPFTDIDENGWYMNAVRFAYTNNLFHGVTETEFAPDSEMTRAMFVAVVGRMAESMGIDATTGTHSFTDVSGNDYFNSYLAWANENGIVYGESADTFNPNGKITREQMVSMLIRFADYAKTDLNADTVGEITDMNTVSDWAVEAVERALAAGIISGFEDSTVRPQNTATRAQVAQLFTNYMTLYR